MNGLYSRHIYSPLKSVLLRNLIFNNSRLNKKYNIFCSLQSTSSFKLCTLYTIQGYKTSTMGEQIYPGWSLKDVVTILNQIAPTATAESWDNVGLLIEPTNAKPVTRILLTNDLTEGVMKEAIALTVDLVISYHPPIFAPLKSVTNKSWKERIVAMCLENRIAVYSPHTSWDAMKGGVNDWLTKAFDCESVEPIQQSFVSPNGTHLLQLEFPSGSDNRKALDELLSKLKSNLKDNSLFWNIVNLETNQMLSIVCSISDVPTIIQTLHQAPFIFEMDSLQVSKYEKIPMVGWGMGRICKLKNPDTVKHLVQQIKDHINIPHLRLALAVGQSCESLVSTIAVCAGSGASVLKNVRADLLLTGEMLHHDVLEATHKGSHVILCNHSDSERGFLKDILPVLNTCFSNRIELVVSSNDKDPLTTI